MFFGQYHDADKSAIVVGSELRPADKLPCPGHTERVGIKLMLLLLMPSVLHGSGLFTRKPAEHLRLQACMACLGRTGTQ